eukprot:158716-Chlamydomonas_euryale.AAC.1
MHPSATNRNVRLPGFRAAAAIQLRAEITPAACAAIALLSTTSGTDMPCHAVHSSFQIRPTSAAPRSSTGLQYTQERRGSIARTPCKAACTFLTLLQASARAQRSSSGCRAEQLEDACVSWLRRPTMIHFTSLCPIAALGKGSLPAAPATQSYPGRGHRPFLSAPAGR